MSTELVVKTDIDSILNNLPNCNPENREIIIASEKEKIKDIEKKEVVMGVKDILVKTIFESGHKFEENDQTTLLMIVCDDLLRDFPRLTIDEIKIAFRNGVRKVYGEYYGITVISIYGWMKKYETETKVEAMRIKQEALSIAREKQYVKPVPTPEEWQQMMYKSSIDLFDTYRANKENALDVGNIHYSFLLGLGLINFTDERKANILKTAEAKLKLESIKGNGDVARMSNRHFLKALEKKEDSAIKVLENEVRRVSLHEFFDDLVMGNSELKPLLDQKLNIVSK